MKFMQVRFTVVSDGEVFEFDSIMTKESYVKTIKQGPNDWIDLAEFDKGQIQKVIGLQRKDIVGVVRPIMDEEEQQAVNEVIEAVGSGDVTLLG